MSEMLPVAILAGGQATRLRPLSETIPKALIDIHGEPFVAHQLRLLCDHGVRQVVLCLGFLGEQVSRVVGDGSAFGMQVQYSFDGSEPLGTAGAIKQALGLLPEAFFVLYGDSYLECDYEAVQIAFEAGRRLALMTVYRNEGHWEASNVEYDKGCILAYDKQVRTSRMRHIDYGLGVFHRSAFDAVPQDSFYDLAVLYREMLRRGQLAAHEVYQRFYEIGSPSGLEELRKYLANKATLKAQE